MRGKIRAMSGVAKRGDGFWRLRAASAPAIGVFAPGRAAKLLARTNTRQLLSICAVYIAATAFLIVPLLLWNAAVGRVYVGPVDPTVGLTGEGRLDTVDSGGVWQMRKRPLAEAWREWRAAGPIGPAEIIFVVAFVLTCAATAFLSWLYLPFVYRSGVVSRAYFDAFRAVAASGGALMAAVLLAATVIAWVGRCEKLGEHSAEPVQAILMFLVIPAVLVTILRRIGRSAETLANTAPGPSLTLICVECGYDLAYLDASGACPECGHGIANSLDPAVRDGVAWERKPKSDSGRWTETVSAILFSPRESYRRLRMFTTLDLARAFARRVYVSVGLCATVWLAAVTLVIGAYVDAEEALVWTLGFGLWTPVCCWLGHRFIGAVVASWWFYRGVLRDGRWAAKVILYESAFLWVFCLFWGVVATSFALWGPWISVAFDNRVFFALAGMPGEPAVVLGGTLALALCWLWRYSLILKSVRWSNH